MGVVVVRDVVVVGAGCVVGGGCVVGDGVVADDNVVVDVVGAATGSVWPHAVNANTATRAIPPRFRPFRTDSPFVGPYVDRSPAGRAGPRGAPARTTGCYPR